MRKLILIILITLFVTIVANYVMSNKNRISNLVAPNSRSTPTPSLAPAPPQTPKTFKFDSSTDLKAEWEKVNPQILDSDFVE